MSIVVYFRVGQSFGHSIISGSSINLIHIHSIISGLSIDLIDFIKVIHIHFIIGGLSIILIKVIFLVIRVKAIKS
jgi:hypothetical protein